MRGGHHAQERDASELGGASVMCGWRRREEGREREREREKSGETRTWCEVVKQGGKH